MAVIFTLKKTGEFVRTHVKEGVTEVWELINSGDPNKSTRDYLLLLDDKNNPIIINKRFIFRIDED